MTGGSRFPGALPRLALSAFLGLLAVRCHAASEPPASFPILGVDPLVKGTQLEYHQDALSHWLGLSFAKMVLLHVDAKSGMSTLEPEKLSMLKGFAGRRDVGGLTRVGHEGLDSLFNDGNFVRAAVELGMVREVVWVMPAAVPDGENADGLIADFLGRAGVSSLDSATFRPGGGCYRGRIAGVPVSLCGQERLPAIQGPVLLSIDAGYFLAAAAWRGIDPLSEIRALFRSLRAARYAVADAVMAFSILDGELPPDLRWLGEAAVQMLQDPVVAQGDAPPERWRALQKLSTLGRSEQQEQMQMLGYALAQLETNPHDPAFLLYAAAASDRHGGGERALAYAEEACRMDRGYCVGLRWAGLRFLERGDVETGLRFIVAGEKLLPGMTYGQLDIGIALMKVGRATEALEALEKLRARDGAFPSDLLAGLVHLHRGDRDAARLAFDRALTAVDQSPGIHVEREEIARAIEIAAGYYREEGLLRQAERLEGNPRLRLPAPQTGP